MIGRALTLGAAAWVGWAWLPHLLTPACAWRGPRHARRLALTFDDGPDPVWTPRLLDALGAAGVRGTFFLIGERAERTPDLVRRMVAEGHEIGNHSWSHRSLWLCGPGATQSEIRRGHECLAELSGTPPRHFRPPWGMVNAAMFPLLRARRLRPVFWSIQPEGLRAAQAVSQASYVVRRAHPGAIVDLHDAEGTPGAPARLVDALPSMIEGLRSAGYELTTVGELLSASAR